MIQIYVIEKERQLKIIYYNMVLKYLHNGKLTNNKKIIIFYNKIMMEIQKPCCKLLINKYQIKKTITIDII